MKGNTGLEEAAEAAAAARATRGADLHLRERRRLQVEPRPRNITLRCELPQHRCQRQHQLLFFPRETDVVCCGVVPLKHKLRTVARCLARAFAAVVDGVDLLDVNVSVPACFV